MMMIRYVEPGGNSDKYSFVVATNECGTQVGIYLSFVSAFLLSFQYKTIVIGIVFFVLPFQLSFQYKTIVIGIVFFVSAIPAVFSI